MGYDFAKHPPTPGRVVSQTYAKCIGHRWNANGQLDDPYELTAAMCWCEAHIVIVTWEDVRQGVTRTCGERECHAPP